MSTTDADLARWRLVTQRLAAPHAASATGVVAGLLAVQAENPAQAAWGVASRTVAREATDLAGLLDSGAVIRTHVLRPTWHFVSAADVGWLVALTAPAIRPLFTRQLADEGWSPGRTDRALADVVDVLGAAPHSTREQVATALAHRGVPISGRALMLLMGLAETDRLVCSGRPADGRHTYARFEDRVPPTAPRERDEALGELAWRYFAGHGPATERDLAYWATVTVTQVRRGIGVVRDRLESFVHEGRTYWHAPGGAAPTSPPRPDGHLLQIFDETYRGYQDTRRLLDTAGRVPRGREASTGMALVDGQMVGWMRRTTGARVRFEVDPFAPLAPSAHRALAAGAARYGAFLGLDHELVVKAAAGAPG
ncbi:MULTISPECIES: winged helix DNA-binding domain-containing protein [unclassified Actinotalea]|uniref:winged helix DNA-binding domain-containing protein n=1 Tax=unclassified Actinotalea TaxID=2638618 RepID=UPI0015F4C3C1|nr:MULTISPECIES: winged helix DNA-binding domain-containing protein [unclassified Actinotalea]